MASCVPALPVELLSSILEKVDSKETLKNATLSSKAFNEIATPHLYKNIDINLGLNDEDQFCASIRKLTVHFLRNPDLAAHVRHLSIRPAFEDRLLDYEDDPKQSLEKTLAESDDLEAEIKDAIKEASHSDREHAKWLEQAEHGDPLLALLLPTFTRLETLDFEETMFPQYMNRMLQRAGRKEKPFQKKPILERLHSFAWVFCDGKYGGSLPFAPFMFPSLTHFYFHRVGSMYEDDAYEELKQIEPRTSSCTHLELADCRLNDEGTTNLLAIPKVLKSFIYEIGWGHIAYCSVNFPTVRTALEQHKHSLEDLSLGYGVDGIEWVAETVSPFRSFRNFAKLRRIKVAPDFVFGVMTPEEDEVQAAGSIPRHERFLNFLPRTIEHLHITHGDEYGVLGDVPRAGSSDKITTLYNAIEHILLHKEALPELKKFILDTSLPRVEEDKNRLAELSRLAASVGLEFVIQNNWGDKKYSLYDRRVEMKWGFDEDVVWKDCRSECHRRPPFEVIDLQH